MQVPPLNIKYARTSNSVGPIAMATFPYSFSHKQGKTMAFSPMTDIREDHRDETSIRIKYKGKKFSNSGDPKENTDDTGFYMYKMVGQV